MNEDKPSQQLDRNALVEIVDLSQKRSCAEEIDMLYKLSEDPPGYLLDKLSTSVTRGIIGDEMDLL
mgnify:CR=1 FL=1